uniref:ATP-dependent DNA helicase RecG n=1 Tax=Gemmiger formicilis TaxID=745368 RepID=UPI003FED43EB
TVTGRILPLYRLTHGISNKLVVSAVECALNACGDMLPELLPAEITERYALPKVGFAYRNVHFPPDWETLALARRRLTFEEFFVLSCATQRLRAQRESVPGERIPTPDVKDFYAALPFSPTRAQRRAADEALRDMASGKRMSRLLQGDVGSGKTLVAAAAIWFAAQNGWQSAMLAPTEILARQHAATLADRLEPFGVNVTLLVGGMKAKEKRIALEAIADGRANLVVGTHAVLTDTVEFKNLGLAIVDEQHRFGVRQRGLLAGKAQSPHLLVMSATPIPRTLGLLMYGDLDISVLDELPPGRKPIKTWFITGKKRRDMYGFLDKQIAAGHQVYIVCPAIEENEAMGDLQAVTTYYTETACALLPNRRIGLLHGKLKPKEKDDVMQRFKAGELDVLVSTTVIEVGVDVPNATVMVIENAERFGLSALHQLRGRVGRGAADSCCILISDNGNDAVRERLQFLCRTSDGFAVAKYDLETRGPGDFFGSAQHGLPTLRVADLVQDTRTLRVAQDEAKALLAKDPNLIDPAHRALSDEVERLFETAGAMN